MRTGKILSAATMLLATAQAAFAVSVTAVNPADFPRQSETVVVPWKQVSESMSIVTPQGIKVSDAGKNLACQVVDLNDDGMPEELVFQADFGPNESKTFALDAQATKVEPPPSKVFGRYVPERYEDFAWENDRIAFRMYGPELEKVPKETGGSGIDVRVKRVRELVLDEWYKVYKSGMAHKDIGNGADFYKVGLGRGCGGTGIYKDGKLYYAMGYRQWKVLANGPVRLVFQLTYEPYDAGGTKVSEVKVVTLDAGSNLCRFQSTFTGEGELPVAVGLQKHQSPGEAALHKQQGWMRYWDAADPGPNGNIGVGAVIDPALISEMTEISDHLLIVSKVQPGKPLTFYAGAGWDKSGDFADVKAWDAYLEKFAKRIQAPIKVTVSQ